MAYPNHASRAALASAIVAVLIAVSAISASAGAGDVDRRGSCSGPSDWRLRVREDDEGKLRVRYEVEGGRAGQEWHVFLSDNGVGFFAGTRISQSGGFFDVLRRTADLAGTDTIRAGANNVVTGETVEYRRRDVRGSSDLLTHVSRSPR